MYAYIFMGLLATLLASSYKRNKYALELAFLILTIFLAIRYEFGQDYDAYLQYFDLSNRGSLQEAIDSSRFEAGWTVLYRFFQPIGFFGMVIILTFLENFIIYRFVKKYVQPRWYWLSVFSYIFTASICLTGMSMMRQFLAMLICMVAIDLALKKKKYVVFSLTLVLLATQFHTSAAICFPFCLIGFLKDIRLSNGSAIFIGLCLIIGGYFLADFFGSYLQLLVRDNAFERYEVTLDDQYSRKYGISNIVDYFILFTILLMQKYQDKNLRFLFCYFIIYMLIDAFKPVAPLIGRLSLYFFIWFPVCWSASISSLNNRNNRLIVGVLAVFILFRIYGLISFVTSPGWGNSFLEYKTIFSAPMWQ